MLNARWPPLFVGLRDVRKCYGSSKPTINFFLRMHANELEHHVMADIGKETGFGSVRSRCFAQPVFGEAALLPLHARDTRGASGVPAQQKDSTNHYRITGGDARSYGRRVVRRCLPPPPTVGTAQKAAARPMCSTRPAI